MDKDTLITDNGPFLVLICQGHQRELHSGSHINLTDATTAYHEAIRGATTVELWESWPRCEPRQVLGYYTTPNDEEDSL